MRFLRKLLDAQGKIFRKGGKLEKLYPLFEAMETLAFSTGKVTRGSIHVRDGLDLKRMMIVVVVALMPIVMFAGTASLMRFGIPRFRLFISSTNESRDRSPPSRGFQVFSSPMVDEVRPLSSCAG